MPSFVVISPSHVCDPQLAIAAMRAGELGLLDLGYCDNRTTLRTQLTRIADQAPLFSGSWGVRWDTLGDLQRSPASLSGLADQPWPYLAIAGLSADPSQLAAALTEARVLAEQVWAEVYDCEQALRAQQAGFDGLILRGHEGGGCVSGDTTFLLLQTVVGKLNIPYWLQGGIGFDTAAAAVVGGAAGVVLAEQLWLTAEAPFTAAERAVWRQFDGSETATVEVNGRSFRFLCRTDRSALTELEQLAAAGGDVAAAIAERLQSGGRTPGAFIPLGQDIALAAKLAGRGLTVADVLKQMRSQIDANLQILERRRAIEVDGPLAKRLGVTYPILQGPMTRVSDTAEFCEAVAANGALPFLALAVMSGAESQTLLQATKRKLGARPWGVGVLGFIPGEMRDAQDAAIAEALPNYAIIAGGRPSQAARFEKLGISTFLHVPSPGLLESFIADGARKFIFEGRECGGHVGPRASFILWQQQIQVLLDAKVADPENFQVVFAGGIHDGLSAAVVSVLAARLVERGMNVGVLMGTSYLFTEEAVRCGAITAEFQRQAVACRATVLLESGVGHATRCARTDFAEDFAAYKNELLLAGKTPDEIRLELELFNIGRLRIASKGRKRNSGPAAEAAKGELVEVGADEQRRTGMYMIGQVAALRDRVVTMAELHAEVVDGCTARLNEIAAAVARSQTAKQPAKVAAAPDEPIAIVGMAGIFPKAADVRKFWSNIFNRIDAVTEVTPDRWSPDVNFSPDRLARDTVYSKWGGFLDEVKFDPFQWRIPPATLSSIEPIQLLSLEVAWNAFRDAGYDHRPFPRERTSVIFGIAGPHDVGLEYSFRTMAPHFLSQLPDVTSETVDALLKSLRSELVEWTEDSFPGFLSNVVAGRIANRLDLGGTNFVVDAACAASLAALHTGIAQLRMGWSDVVLLGTADGSNNLFTFQSFSKTHALSPRGRSRPFDDSADGIAIGEAVAALVLKRLSDAERDGDQIYAVIRGIGSSSDGNNRSLTAPHPPGQVQAIRRAYVDAQVDAGTVSLVEAHGTGTAVGDRSEIQALVDAFSDASKMRQRVAVGSIKSMIGHTKTAAGVVGVVKTALALRHRVLPPTIGVEEPNRQVDFSHSPFYVNTEVRPWFQELGEHPRRAGVSAFGFGGTNFHVVMEEYERTNVTAGVNDYTPRPVEVFCWRRTTRDELLNELRRLAQQLENGAPENLTEFAAACWEQERRRVGDFNCRLAIVASSGTDFTAKLKRAVEKLSTQAAFSDPTGIEFSSEAPLDAGEVCFLYPGQGSQAVSMLRDLAAISPWCHELFARWNRLLANHLPNPLTRYIYPPPAFNDAEREAQRVALVDTRVAQPALGAVEVFATQLLARFNIRPAFTGGHSYGEYAALYAAHCFDADDLLAVSAVRGRVSAEAVSSSPGAMAAVQAGPDVLQKVLDELRLDVTIANRNSPQQSVIAGGAAAIDSAVQQLKDRGLRATRLAVSAPFHTPALATGAGALGTQLSSMNLRDPKCAVYSNTIGDRFPLEPSAIRALLQRHLIEPVQFDRQIERMHADGARLFIEVGPGRTLTGLVGQILTEKPHACLNLDSAGRDGVTQFAHLLAAAIKHGVPVQLDAWYAGRSSPSRSPREVLQAEAAARKLKPTDCYISPARIRPASAPATKPAAPAAATTNAKSQAAEPAKLAVVAPAVATPASSAPPSRTVTPSAATQSPQPLTKKPTASEKGLMSAAESPNEATVLSNAVMPNQALAAGQAMIAQWLTLQNSQIQLNERFLRLQERMMFGDSSAPTVPLMASPEYVAPKSIPAPAPVVPTPASAPQPQANGAAVRATPLSKSRGAISIPSRASEAPSEARLLATAAPLNRAPAAPVAPKAAAAPVATNGHVVPAAAPLASVSAEGPPPTAQFEEDLLRVVSERTGYPVDMLDKDLPLEAGLGIDSIKTVEVFSKLKPYHAYFQRPDQGEEEVLKVFTRLKTLGDIINLYDEQRKLHFAGNGSTAPVAAAPAIDLPSSSSSTVNRFELEVVEAVAPGDEKKNRLTTIL